MHPKKILAAYASGKNITQLLRAEKASGVNTEEIIETAYDLQTGSYVAGIEDQSYRQHKVDYGGAIADEVLSLVGEGATLLEPGVGEGTTLSFVLGTRPGAFAAAHGFDISWSRITKCREWLASQGIGGAFLSVASIFNAPYRDDSFDVVYTSHTIEPNGGAEAPILQELYRITSRYLILLEPGYELASPEAQRRMEHFGYVQGLKEHAEQLGMAVVKHELFPHAANPLNPTAITVIAKNPDAANRAPELACPRYGEALQEHGDSFYSPGSLRAYPKILGVPCLRVADGVLASKYSDVASAMPG